MKKHTESKEKQKMTKAKIKELKENVTTQEQLITELFDILLETPVEEINKIEAEVMKHIEKQKKLEGKLLKVMIEDVQD